MAPYIMENCIICGTCWDICPKDAVEEHGDYYRITARCDECGKCIKACPNHAIAITASRGQELERRARADRDSDDV
jgi:MinD superfamily P-loop ATPase